MLFKQIIVLMSLMFTDFRICLYKTTSIINKQHQLWGRHDWYAFIYLTSLHVVMVTRYHDNTKYSKW